MKLTEDKIRKAIEELDIDNFEIESIEYCEKGWWDVYIKTFYGCWLSELNLLSSYLDLGDNDEIIIAPVNTDFLGFNLSIFDK